MSHSFAIKRPITKSEFLDVIAGDHEFLVLAEGEAFAVVRWSDGEENAVFNLVKGAIHVGTPTARVMDKMNTLAEIFGAEVLGMTDDASEVDEIKTTAGFTTTWIGWPIMVVTLIALLIWRW